MDVPSSDLLRGVKAISEYIGETERATFRLAQKRLIPAFKRAGRWRMLKSKYAEHLALETASRAA